MIELALAGLIAFATVPAASPGPLVEQVQFRGGPGGQCPHGYDFNHSNGRCYPNDYHAPGYYTAPQPTYRGRGYYRGDYGGPEYHGRRGGLCPDGYDYNYSSGQCFPNRARAPGMYGR